MVKMITVMWDTFYSLLLTETVFCLNMIKYSFESHVMSCHGDTVIKCFKVPALQNSLTGLEQEMHQIFNNARDAELQSRGPGRNSQELSIILKTFFVIIILNQVTDNQTVKNNAIYLIVFLFSFCRNPSVYQQAAHIPPHPSWCFLFEIETQSGYPGMMGESRHISSELVHVQFNLIAILKCRNDSN